MGACRVSSSLLGLLLLAAVPASRPVAQEGPRDAVLALETRLNDALMACDAAALGELWDARLSFVFPNGVSETRQQRLEGLAECRAGAQKSVIASVSTIDLGASVVAVVLSDWSAEFGGKPFQGRFRATHVWTRHGAAWTLVAAHVSQLEQPAG